RPAAGMGAASSAQSRRSAHPKCPGNSAPHAHTRRSLPMPQRPPYASSSAPCQQRTPHLSGRHRPGPPVPPPATLKPSPQTRSSVPFSCSCPALPAPHYCLGQRPPVLHAFLHMPVPNLPVALIGHRRQAPARIHGMRVSHRRKHRLVEQCVSVCMRTSQINPVFLRDALHRTKLFFSIHRFSQHTPRPPSLSFFHPRCAHPHPAPVPFVALQRRGNSLRQQSQRLLRP